MAGNMGIMAAAIGAFGALAASTPALANAFDHHEERTGSTTLNLEVVGHVAQHCGLGRIQDVNFPTLDGIGLGVIENVGLACNVPFDMTIQAANGALANDHLPGGQGGFAGKVGYDMSVAIPVRTPNAELVTADFRGEDLRNGQTVSSRDGVAFDGARLHIRLRPVTGAGLLAGDYSETISVSIAPKI